MRNWKKGLLSCVLSAMLVATSSSAAFAARKVTTTADATEREIRNAKLSMELATEGMVLLENNNNALPIQAGGNIALFGAGATQTVKGGTGSGAVNNRLVYDDGTIVEGVSNSASVLDGFLNAGYTIPTEAYLREYNTANSLASASGTGMGAAIYGDDWLLTNKQIDAVQAQTDTAVYVIRRSSGEGNDRLPQKGDYYLSDAELANIQLLAARFEQCIVVLNVGGVVDTSWFADSGADAMLLMSQAGERGGDAAVKVLNGGVNPSGKLTDTWAADFSDYPSSEFFAAINAADPFGSHVEFYSEDIYVGYRYFDTFAPNKVLYPFGYGLSYTSFDIATESVTATKDEVTVVAKVTNTGDTFAGKEVVQIYYSAPKGDLHKPYQELVAYGKTDLLAPGQSQTLTIAFDPTTMASYDEVQAAYIMETGAYTLRVGNSSRNTAPVAMIELDKTVVTQQLTNQMVMNRPGKNPGGSTGGRGTPPYNNQYEVTIEENVARYEALHSAFTASVANAQPFDDGKSAASAVRLALAASDLENTENVYATLTEGQTLEDTFTYLSATTEQVDVNGYNYQSDVDYQDFAVYFDEQGAAGSTEPAQLKNFRVKSGSEADGTAEYYTLEDVYKGVLTMEQFVSGLTIEEMANIVEGGNKSPHADGQSAGGTSPSTQYASQSTIEKIDSLFVKGEAGETCGLYFENRLIPNITLADGPAGLRITQSFEDEGVTYYQFCTAFPIGTLLAQSWDRDVVYRMGQAIGEEMAEYGITIWLAPGMNIHRNPLCGRNFEYYSEDPVLSGSIASAEGKGVQANPGVGVSYKHFAVNNQETTRNAQNNVVSERALREIYLKGFEIAVKESMPMTIMTSYNINNSQTAANDYDLMSNILRKEWGFDGLVMTDWGGSGGYSDARAMHAGNDIIMAGKPTSNITGYIIDAQPAIAYDEQGIATDGGYPYVSMTTRASGTTVTYATVSQWGDYQPAAEGGAAFVVTTTADAFHKETRPVRIYLDADGNGYMAQPSGVTVTQELQQWTIQELLNGKNDAKGNHLNGMQDDGLASYTEADGKVTITYNLAKLSAKDNVSTGHQNPTTTDLFGNPDENTLALGDLQKSVIHILNVVMSSTQFADLIGIDAQSYTEARADQLVRYISVAKGEISK